MLPLTTTRPFVPVTPRPRINSASPFTESYEGSGWLVERKSWPRSRSKAVHGSLDVCCLAAQKVALKPVFPKG